MAGPVGPFTLLGTPPRSNNPREVERWFQQIYTILAGIPGIAWDVIDKTGSSIADLEFHDHNLTTNRDATAVHPHASLELVLQADEDSTSADLEKHLTDLLAYEWERNRVRARTITSDDTAVIGEHLTVDCTAGDVTVTLPDATTNEGYPLWIHKSDAGAYRVLTSVKNIRYQGSTMHLVSNGTDWVIS